MAANGNNDTLPGRKESSRIFYVFVIAAAALFFVSFVHLPWAFFVLAVFMGFSQGGIGTSQSPLVASLFGLKSHGLILGCLGSGFTIGAAVGPFMTGYFFDVRGSYHLAILGCAVASTAAIVFACRIKNRSSLDS